MDPPGSIGVIFHRFCHIPRPFIIIVWLSKKNWARDLKELKWNK